MSVVLPRFGPLDLTSSLRTLRAGVDDPTWAFTDDGVWHAMQTPEGPATLHLAEQDDEIVARAWGDGAHWLLDRVPEFIGMHDPLEGFEPGHHPRVAALVREHPGFRLPRGLDLMESLVWVVAAQGKSSFIGHRAFRQLVQARGVAAPGPKDLLVLPEARALVSIPNYELHTHGFEQDRADLLRRIVASAGTLVERFVEGIDATRSVLVAIDGLDVGSVELALLRMFGAPDATPTGDQRRAAHVGELLADDPRIDDDRMLELLEPFTGHRGRVIRLAEAAATTWQRHRVPVDADRTV